MPASIILSNLSLSTPDGRSLLAGIDLTFGAERTGLVGRNGVGKTTLLAAISGDHLPQSGRVLINGTIGLLRQDVQLPAGATVADLFGVRSAVELLRRAERGDASIDDMAAIDWTLEGRLEIALARLGFDLSPDTELSCLSGGQITRVRLAALLFAQPDFLLLDEPTNNLDLDGRKAVIDFLATWRGGAIVVSHDRNLLEAMNAIVELTSLGATRYGGNWSHYQVQKALELAAVRQDLAHAEKSLQPLSIRLAATGLPAAREVVWLDSVSAGYRTEQPVLRGLSFTMVGPERVALTGPNGSGKTTLLKVIAGELPPIAGTVRVRPDFAFFDQKVSLLDPALSILENFGRLNPAAGDNACHAALARFMFRANAALQPAGSLSGGQMFRAGLACVLGGAAPPSLLILDEPTNHLDIESVEAVEAGLRAYDGALLVVSHDEAFLQAIGITRRLDLIASMPRANGRIT